MWKVCAEGDLRGRGDIDRTGPDSSREGQKGGNESIGVNHDRNCETVLVVEELLERVERGFYDGRK